jgi:integrase
MRAPATERAYQADRRDFLKWCDENHRGKPPTLPVEIGRYLMMERDRGRKPATIARRRAAIDGLYLEKGFDPPPTRSEIVASVMRDISLELRSKKHRRRTTAIRPASFKRMLDHCNASSLIGLRDRAMLRLLYEATLRRGEVVALKTGDIGRFDQSIRNDILAWIKAARISDGFVFRCVAKAGRVQEGILIPESVNRIVRKYARQAGLPGVSSDSLQPRSWRSSDVRADRLPPCRVYDRNRIGHS